MDQSIGLQALTESWFERVWNSAEEDAIHELLSPDCEIVGSEAKGLEGFVPLWKSFQNTFEEISVQIRELVCDQDSVAGVVEFAGRHVASCKSVSFPIGIVAEWRNGQIIRARNVLDFGSLLTQVEFIEPSLLAEVFVK